ncbi:hypothetical protein [Allokutzneria albata]|uniref:Tetratricopeptide repeat-containing protein n=1 Tax=Allokutzneria albata TaxID=211114 RepID=A0A1G9S2C3_ALLAB|nr:hypothetical protein [Allokutzneria albata]SDM29564.1 hypothetical protein SAMN04489726_0842 [Allokutzneria albata]
MSLIGEVAEDIKGAVVCARNERAHLGRCRFQLDQYRRALAIVHSGSNDDRVHVAVLRCLLALGHIHAAQQELVRAEEAMLAYLDACGVTMPGEELVQTAQDAVDLAERTAQTTLSLISNEQTYDPPPTTSEFGPEQVIGQLALSITLITINCVTKAVQIIDARKRR